MMTIFDLVTLKYPSTEGITYFYTKPDGTNWDDPYDGLVWENTTISKPTKDDLATWVNDPVIIAAYNSAQNAIINAPIYDQLNSLDLKSIRACRENNTVMMAQYEAQAVALRAKLAK